MSGIEVVGLVLGILPLAIKAVKGYSAIKSLKRSVVRDLKFIIRALETEKVFLEDTCEMLLIGIVPSSRIDGMVDEPFGHEWDQFSDDIRERLWKATGTFKERAKEMQEEMQEAMEELTEKLCIGADGKTKLNSREAIKEARIKASFSLKMKDYEDIINRINTANLALRNLTGTRDLEPSRRLRSQARVTKLIRDLSRGIFDALRSAATCHCVQSHDVCLELVPRKAVLMRGDLEDNLAKKFNFHVMLGSYESPGVDTDCSGQDEKRVRPLERPNRWDSLRIQFEPKSEPSMKSPSSLSVPLSNPRSPSPRRSVRFSKSSSTETLNIVEALKPVLKSDLCQVVFTWHGERRELATKCCGYIADPHRKFGLYPQHRHPKFSSAVTLRQMLGGRNAEFQKLGLLEKMRIALAISMSILHLYDTPWLAGALTLDDVVFFRENEMATSHPDSPLTPFMAKNFVRRSDAAAPREAPPQSNPDELMNLTVLSLGAMLIQVMIGQEVPALDMAAGSDMDIKVMLEKHEAASKLKDKVLYIAAVKWCLDIENLRGIVGLESYDFCQSFYEGVVARLQNDIQLLSSRW